MVALGRLTGLLATVKGLPLAYNRDLQEDKPPVFAARADVQGALAALGVFVAGITFDRARERVSSQGRGEGNHPSPSHHRAEMVALP